MNTDVRRAFALSLALVGATLSAAHAGSGRAALSRPQGPCDIYAAAGDPCVAAHSTTRALYAAFTGPLYQVLRQSDDATLDIGVVAATEHDAGGYANAAAQDAFCANTYCWIVKIYDQSPKHNDLTQAPRGGFSGPAMGGLNNVPLADMAPVTVMGHRVYGVFIVPGMGLRNDDPAGTAVDDQAEGQYWVINGRHFNNGCCFDYGNAEIDSRDDGNGTMETAYYGDATGWYHGPPPGPWIMTDQENNLVGCVNAGTTSKACALPNITWRFVTAIAKGEPHHWTSMGGNAQQGALSVMFDGPRVNASYDPMRKQGAILLGNGGDNSNGSQGTFYEGVMTAAGTFPTDATDQLVQANIVAAAYQAPAVVVKPASADAPTGVQTFAPGSSHDVTVAFTNPSDAAIAGLDLSVTVPAQWKAVGRGLQLSQSPATLVQPGQTMSETFTITSGPAAFNGDLVASAVWGDGAGAKHRETAVEKVRNVSPVKINEFRIGNGGDPTNAFIELYNAGASTVDLSNWTLTEHATQQAIFSTITIPAGTRLAAHGFYLLGLSDSGLAAAAHRGDTTIDVRSTAGMSVGDALDIDMGAGAETRKIVSVGTQAGPATTVWQPLPDGLMTIPTGSTNVPVTSVAGFVIGEKIALGYGATSPAVASHREAYEVATVTAIGKPGTQARLSAEAPAGSTNIKVSAADNISVGDKIRLDIASVGHGIEWATVVAVGTGGANGTGLTLAAPLKFDHAANLPFSDRGTGVSITPATKFPHSSNEPVQTLGTGLALDRPLSRDHAIDAVVADASVTAAGYQGSPSPNQWFGGPALAGAGAMVLRDAAGRVVDSLNYGGVVDPWIAEGNHSMSGPGQSGCHAPSMGVGRPTGPGRQGGTSAIDRSVGRFPDGADTDSNCDDFFVQAATMSAAASPAGASNIKVASVTDFSAGESITIDADTNAEAAMIAAVGTAGATTIGAAVDAGATAIVVASPAGFAPGQAITIDSGASAETAVVASTTGGRGGRGGAPIAITVTVSAPLAFAHPAGAQISGTGITLATPLTKPHAAGVRVASAVPTPGAPNQYVRKR